MDSTVINFDKPTFKKFKKRYDEAVEKKEEEFIFEGNFFLTDYAKYVIEYLEDKFKG